MTGFRDFTAVDLGWRGDVRGLAIGVFANDCNKMGTNSILSRTNFRNGLDMAWPGPYCTAPTSDGVYHVTVIFTTI
jgi:hypothetical protein